MEKDGADDKVVKEFETLDDKVEEPTIESIKDEVEKLMCKPMDAEEVNDKPEKVEVKPKENEVEEEVADRKEFTDTLEAKITTHIIEEVNTVVINEEIIEKVEKLMIKPMEAEEVNSKHEKVEIKPMENEVEEAVADLKESTDTLEEAINTVDIVKEVKKDFTNEKVIEKVEDSLDKDVESTIESKEQDKGVENEFEELFKAMEAKEKVEEVFDTLEGNISEIKGINVKPNEGKATIDETVEKTEEVVDKLEDLTNIVQEGIKFDWKPCVLYCIDLMTNMFALNNTN